MESAKHVLKKVLHPGRTTGAGADEYDTTPGATVYDQGVTGGGIAGAGHHHHHHHEHEHAAGMATGVTSGEVIEERPVAVGVAEVPVVVTEQESRVETHHTNVAQEEVCGQKVFTEVEDRPVVRERVERIVEHRPVEKQYVVETRFVGEREAGAAGAEIVDVKERVVDVAEPGPRCPVNAGTMMEEGMPGMGAGTGGLAGTGGGLTGTGGTHATDRL